MRALLASSPDFFLHAGNITPALLHDRFTLKYIGHGAEGLVLQATSRISAAIYALKIRLHSDALSERETAIGQLITALYAAGQDPRTAILPAIKFYDSGTAEWPKQVLIDFMSTYRPYPYTTNKTTVMMDFALQEYSPGVTLAEFLTRMNPAEDAILSVVVQLLLVLCDLQNGFEFVHTDIHPHNVLVESDSSRAPTVWHYTVSSDTVFNVRSIHRPRLLDFGLSRWNYAGKVFHVAADDRAFRPWIDVHALGLLLVKWIDRTLFESLGPSSRLLAVICELFSLESIDDEYSEPYRAVQAYLRNKLQPYSTPTSAFSYDDLQDACREIRRRGVVQRPNTPVVSAYSVLQACRSTLAEYIAYTPTEQDTIIDMTLHIGRSSLVTRSAWKAVEKSSARSWSKTDNIALDDELRKRTIQSEMSTYLTNICGGKNTYPYAMKCVQCTTPLRAGCDGHGQYRSIGGDVSAVHACSTACARASMAVPNSIHSVQVGRQHPLHAVMADNPWLVAAVGEALADGSFRVTRPAVAAPLVAWVQQVGPKRSAYDDDEMADAGDDELRGARTMDRGTSVLSSTSLAWRGEASPPTAPSASRKRSADYYPDDDDEYELHSPPAPSLRLAPPEEAPLPPLRRSSPLSTSTKRSADDLDDDDIDMEPAPRRGMTLRRIPSPVVLEMIEALVMSGALPMKTFDGMSRLAHKAGESVEHLRVFLDRLPPGLVGEAASSLLRRRVRTVMERLEISMAVILLLRNRAGASRIKNSRTLTTPLHWAARGGYAAVAEVALATGADINAADAYGFTPLDYAVAGGQPAHTTDPSETMASWLEERLAVRSGRAFTS